MKVEQTPKFYEELPLIHNNFGVGEVVIITHVPDGHRVKVGEPAMISPQCIVFMGSKTYTRDEGAAYKGRRLLKGERVVIEQG